MADLLTSLPGDIPGLLRPCSPIRASDTHAVVDLDTACGDALIAIAGWPGRRQCAPWVLDLTDATGRVHAAWWANEHCGRSMSYIWASAEEWCEAIVAAICGLDMTPAQIDALARLVLRLAGR